MSISEPFIRRPIATSLLMLGVLVFGIGAYGLLPVAALPKVDFPTIVVSVNYPGASPDVREVRAREQPSLGSTDDLDARPGRVAPRTWSGAASHPRPDHLRHR